MIILGIETSCDETAAAVLSFDYAQDKQKRITILSNVVASSSTLQAKYGGVIPEQAAREQIRSIIPVIDAAISNAKCQISNIDAVAVTYGPGLIGSLLVGVETAKTLATIWEKPLIPINHLLGHFYANWIAPSSLRAKRSNPNLEIASSPSAPRNDVFEEPSFPCLGLLVSGGHTDLVLFKDHNKYEYLGGTRDDAAGECFDKCARLLGLPYPGGPEISKLASQGDSLRFKLPRPMIDSKDFDFSFSGLKTAVANLLHTSEVGFDSSEVNDLAASIEAAIVNVLVEKTIRAAKKFGVSQLMVAGGVAANQRLVSELKLKIENLKLKIKVAVPPPSLCTDNGAMIASAAFFSKPSKDPLSIQADPNLSLS